MISPLIANARHATLREYLFGLELFGIKLGLDNIAALLGAAENPHLELAAVHIAGTNGKGSVTAFLDAILSKAGYRTGRFTSPHLIELNERFLIGQVPMQDAALDAQIDFFQKLSDAQGLSPTFFEMTTAIAFRAFAQLRVDAALIEVGLGGRLDSTNIVSPLLCAITNIDLEHTEHLGNTLAAIAHEKAGIIKPGVPLVCTETRPEPFEVIASRARELGCAVDSPGGAFEYSVSGGPWRPLLTYASEDLRIDAAPLGLAGWHQAANAAVAVRCAERLMAVFPEIDRAAICAGLACATWPCRLERVSGNPPVIMDVAHNPAGAARLAEMFSRCVCVLAVSADKNARAMLQALAPCAERFLLAEFSNKRAMPLDQLRRCASDLPHEAFGSLRAALERGLELACESTPLLITGSIFTAGEARQILVELGVAPPIQFA